MVPVSHPEWSDRGDYGDPVSDVREALEIQAVACRRLGSAQYADLLHAMVADHDRGGLIVSILSSVPSTTRHSTDAHPNWRLGSRRAAVMANRSLSPPCTK
jgi:hypothetical protein